MKEVILITKKIIKNIMVGSRYEPFDVNFLWDLGNEVKKLVVGSNFTNVLREIETECNNEKIRFDERLYKYGKIASEFWTKEEFQKVLICVDTWGKLREVIPSASLVLESESKINRHDIDYAVELCKGKTYTEVREIFYELRKKGDPVFDELGFDVYDIDDRLHKINESLRTKIDQRDAIFEGVFRKTFDERMLKDIRLYLSSLQKEDVFTKYAKEIKSFAGKSLPTSSENSDVQEILDIINELRKLIKSSKGREMLHEQFISSNLGFLSTYMKALSSDDNLNKFKENEKVLKMFLSGLKG